jgi:2,3-bisphosphoglycerate-independent phosphoglycerate mutase
MNNAQVLIDKKGPLPINVSFETTQKMQTLIVAGSVWSKGINKVIGIDVIVDNNERGEAEIWANPKSTHLEVVPQFIVLNLDPGTHTLVLQGSTAETVSDHNDLYRVLLLE